MQAVNTALQKGSRSTQRDRLVAGMVAAANRAGYAGANVSAVIAEAGVSRPTFYEYFADKDDCLLATIVDVQAGLSEGVERAIERTAPEEACLGAIAALVEFAESQPAQARFLLSEALAGGPHALDARDGIIDEVARAIERRERSARDGAAAPDVPVTALLGAVQRVLGARLRRGVLDGRELRARLGDWLRAYEKPIAAHRWREPVARGDGSSSPSSAIRLRAPAALGPGRPRLSASEVAENHRQRLLFAAAKLAAARGYTATTIADVCEAADLDRRAFYAVFADKRELFMAAHEFGFQRLLAVTAGAYFSGSSWPQRIWQGLKGLSEFLQSNPTLAHVGFVDAYAVGPGAVQRVEDSVSAFGVFLQEGYRYEPRVSDPSPIALEAIVAGAFEIVYRQARVRSRPALSRWNAPMSFIALAPFLGAPAADLAIERELDKRRTGA
jgi:AcrR family transcriptional regulator